MSSIPYTAGDILHCAVESGWIQTVAEYPALLDNIEIASQWELAERAADRAEHDVEASQAKLAQRSQHAGLLAARLEAAIHAS